MLSGVITPGTGNFFTLLENNLTTQGNLAPSIK
jgi:hypothetical protein